MVTFLAILGFPLSMQIGHAIDLSIDEPIYERPSQEPRVTVVPLIGRHGNGFEVRSGYIRAA